MAFNAKEAVVIARKFSDKYMGNFVVKAQVQTLARSKGYFRQTDLRSGIHIVDSIDKIAEVTEKMCGKVLYSTYNSKTYTSNPDGYLCHSVLVMENLPIEKEFFV